MKEEIFGPVLPVISCATLEQAISKMEDHPDSLAVYVFTADPEVEDRVRLGTRSGALCVNDVMVHVASVELPFGGTGNSGMGRYRGRASFDLFTRERVILERGLWPDLPFRYPPLPHLRLLKWFSKS
jgi:aldehyde dehydrogenase (NAD+)